MRDRRTLRHGRGWWSATLTLLAALALILPTPAQADDVTVQQLIDAIFADTYDPALDLNGDGYVDIADIVCLHNDCHKDVWFSTVGKTVDEGAGTIQVHVEFEQALTTTLFYSIKGTATAGADFTDANGGAIAVSGSSADIPIQILNDGEVNEEIEDPGDPDREAQLRAADVDSRAIRFQETVDRLPTFLGEPVPVRIGERVIRKYTDVHSD